MTVLPVAARQPQQAEQGIARRRNRDRDRQHVVDDQRAAGQHADLRPQHLAGHQVAAAAAGKRLDDVAVAGRDDEHREHRRQRQEDRQVRMLPQVLERLGRAVARAGQAVGPQAHPGQKRHQRNVLIDAVVGQVERLADQQRLDLLGDRRLLGRNFVLGIDLANGG